MISIMHRHVVLALLLLISGVASAALGFSVTDTAGESHRLADYRGKWVLVNYWATWCPPCLEEIPDLVALYDERHDKDLMVIGVAMQYKSSKEVADYVDDMLMSFPSCLATTRLRHRSAQPTCCLPPIFSIQRASSLQHGMVSSPKPTSSI